MFAKLLLSTLLMLNLQLVTAAPLLVISAAPSEAQPTMDALSSIGVSAEYFEAGISINAAMNIAALKEKAQNRQVLYIGSGGTLGDYTFPTIVSISYVYWMPTAQRLNLGDALMGVFTPLPVGTEFIAATLPRLNLLASPTISHVSNVNITGLPDKNSLIENMEGYYIIKALQDAQSASVDVIMGITNQCNSEAHNEWVINAPIVAQMTANYVKNYYQQHGYPHSQKTYLNKQPTPYKEGQLNDPSETCWGDFCNCLGDALTCFAPF
jgi:hypothetical protein